MNKTYLKKLEYYQILEQISNYCHTYIGKEKVLNLEPSNDKEKIVQMLSETEQAICLLDRKSTPPLSEIANIEIYIKLLESHNTLTPKALLDICTILKMSHELKQYFYGDETISETYPILDKYFSELYSNQLVIQNIENSILDENTISDNASNTLKKIRRSYKQTEQDIKNQLNSILHSSTYSKYIQENIVTIRNNRYVIPIKQEYKEKIKGFTHDISSSGSTYFIEPISIFQLNNVLNNLKIEEEIEIEKILQILSSSLFPYTEELLKNIEFIGILDFIFAKAKYSKKIKGITPKINTEKNINLIKARHPLIPEGQVVPITIDIGHNFSLLIITGPNTGGKTVTLKTVGLLCCMAYSGLNIPAEENSSIYVFDEIFADIGDDQSISDSLSTFSSHMKNIANIVNTATSDSLVLVDELGSGTDPLEGANLAISILEYLKNNNTLTIATTHYQELKQYALTTNRVQNASVEFDIENLKPTYRLLIGIPGKSNAFAISEKLGLKKEILDNAKSLLHKKDVDFENLLKNIYDEKLKIEKEKEEIEKTLNQVTILKNNLQHDNFKIQAQQKELIDNAKLKAREILLNAKDEASDLISKMKNLSVSDFHLKEMNNIRNTINSSIKNITFFNEQNTIQDLNIDKSKFVPETRVFIKTLGQNGIIISNINKSNEVKVQIGSIKTNININNLEILNNVKQNNQPTSRSNSHISKTRTVSSEINVIGLSVDEAIPLVDKFIDDCFLAKLQYARIVHGKGTGKLRNGIHSFLKKNKHIISFRLGTYGEGEMGVTIVELATK